MPGYKTAIPPFGRSFSRTKTTCRAPIRVSPTGFWAARPRRRPLPRVRPKRAAAAGLTGSKPKLFSLLLAAALCGPAAAAPSASQASTPQTSAQTFQFALPNGMQVLVIPDHRAPDVTQMLWFKVGAVDDPPGISGLAHF